MISPAPINLKRIVREAMRNYGFVPDFPPHVTAEVEALPDSTKDKTDSGIRDLRNLLWSSIDNVDSRDLDQIEYCGLQARQEIRVLVAIADVDCYVAKGTPTDRHASQNGTSVYTGVETFTLFPTRLSWGFSSLNENGDRLAVVAEFFVQRDGNVRFGNVFRALVQNKAKLMYEEIGDWLEEKTPCPECVTKIPGLKEQLLLQDEAAQRLYEFRMESGALELETIEATPLVEGNQVTDLVMKTKNRARYLIENLMITANRTMVGFLEKHRFPLIQRIVRTPERWDRIVEVAETLGKSLPPLPDSKALSDFLADERRRDALRFPDLSLAIVKLIGPGEYVMVNTKKGNLGHFGLAVSDYTHSTAPNRRYVDLIIQRLIKAALEKKPPPYNTEELEGTASWCTIRDKAAKKVERFMRKVAGALLLEKHVGEVFDAIVTGASDKGTYARIFHPPVEGRVVRGEKGMDIGQTVKVRLARIDVERGYVDFEKANHNTQ